MEQARLEQTILKNLIQNEPFTRKVLPFLKSEYFTESDEKIVFKEIQDYFLKYTKPPTTEALLINLDNNTSINENELKMSKTVIGQFDKETTPMDWLTEETEKWCKDRAIYYLKYSYWIMKVVHFLKMTNRLLIILCSC